MKNPAMAQVLVIAAFFRYFEVLKIETRISFFCDNKTYFSQKVFENVSEGIGDFPFINFFRPLI